MTAFMRNLGLLSTPSRRSGIEIPGTATSAATSIRDESLISPPTPITPGLPNHKNGPTTPYRPPETSLKRMRIGEPDVIDEEGTQSMIDLISRTTSALERLEDRITGLEFRFQEDMKRLNTHLEVLQGDFAKKQRIINGVEDEHQGGDFMTGLQQERMKTVEQYMLKASKGKAGANGEGESISGLSDFSHLGEGIEMNDIEAGNLPYYDHVQQDFDSSVGQQEFHQVNGSHLLSPDSEDRAERTPSLVDVNAAESSEAGPSSKRPRRQSQPRKTYSPQPILVRKRPNGGFKQQEKLKKRAEAAAKRAKKEVSRKKRSFFGRLLTNSRRLNMGNGVPRGKGEWPPRGPNTVKGTLQEIICDACKGRCHWSCAGYIKTDEAPDNWDCADCVVKIREGTHRGDIEQAPLDKCIRGDCVMRCKQAPDREEDDEKEYVVEKIIGRQAVARDPETRQRVFEYLVKWPGYDIRESTWEPRDNIDGQGLIDEYIVSATELGVELKKKISLLPEARVAFSSEMGRLIGAASTEDGNEDGRVEDGYQGDNHWTETNGIVFQHHGEGGDEVNGVNGVVEVDGGEGGIENQDLMRAMERIAAELGESHTAMNGN